MTTYGLLNLGRDKDPNHSTDRVDEAALRRLLEMVGDEDACVFGVEISEGDDNNELALFRKVFAGWTMYAGHPENRVREPIFLSPDQADARWQVTWVRGTAVQHWSPPRSVLTVNRGTDVVLACHNAAGPHTAGDRPERYREALATSWERSNRARVKTKRRLQRRGHNVTEMSDLNHYSLPGLPGELTVVHERTDYGFALPARGFRPDFHAGRSAAAGLDSHGIHVMHGTYRKEK